MNHAIIIGSARCGTTSLYNALCMHPQVCRCIKKEPEWFTTRQLHRHVSKCTYPAYRTLWPTYNSNIHKIAIEASSGYTQYPYETNVAKHIFNEVPSARLIMITRNPREKYKSMLRFDYPGRPPETYFRFLMDYKLQLAQYQQYFPPEQILVLKLEDFISNADKELCKVLEFLDLYQTPIRFEHLNASQ